MGGRRSFRAARCGTCGLHEALCACAEAPRVAVPTRVVVVQNHHEATKPTSTGRLAALAFRNSALLPYAVRGGAFAPAPLRDPAVECCLVFHRDEAQPLLESPDAGAPRRRTLVFLDGTWAQCSRMSRRVPLVCELPCVALPAGPPSPWRVRRETHPARMSTMEAILRALELFEGVDAVAPARRWFDVVSARTMFMKGLLPAPTVPPEWAQQRAAFWDRGRNSGWPGSG